VIGLLTGTGWRLAGDRLAGTLVGCAIALLAGYASRPAAWYAHLPGQFANAVDKVSRYTERPCSVSCRSGPSRRRTDRPGPAPGSLMPRRSCSHLGRAVRGGPPPSPWRA